MVEIQQKQLSADKLSVFKSSGKLGKKETKRDIVKQAFYKEKLGLELNDNEKNTLHVAVDTAPVENEQSDSDSSEEGKPFLVDAANEPEQDEKHEAMEMEPAVAIDDESDSPAGLTYVEEVKEVTSNAPPGLMLRLNDDSIEDMKRIREDLSTAVPEELKKRAYFVSVKRSAEIEEQRSKLPVCAMEQEIMEAINYHDVVIVCGETGSGKTTQVSGVLFVWCVMSDVM